MKIRLFVTAVLAAALSVCLCACGGNNARDISMYDLKSAMSAVADNGGEMVYTSSQDPDPQGIFANISKMDYAKVDSFFIYYAARGKRNADEIAVVQVKDSSDVSLAKSEMERHVTKRIALYETYDKTQLGKLRSARIEVNGNCVALVVCDGAEKAANAFHTFLDGE